MVTVLFMACPMAFKATAVWFFSCKSNKDASHGEFKAPAGSPGTLDWERPWSRGWPIGQRISMYESGCCMTHRDVVIHDA